MAHGRGVSADGRDNGMSKPYTSDGVLVGLVDFVLLAGVGLGAWWLVDAAVPAAWCGGGRWDGIFLFVLMALIFGRYMRPPDGRAVWPRSALLAGCAAVATPAAVMAGRLIAGCTDAEGTVSVWVMLPHILAGPGIGLATVATYLLLARRLPAAEGKPPAGEAGSVGRETAYIAALLGGVLFAVAYPHFLDAAATALLGGYCPDVGGNSILYAVALVLLIGALRDGGRPGYRAVALAGLAAIASMSAADLLAGLLVSCPTAGDELPPGQWLLRRGVEVAGFAAAMVLIMRARGGHRPERTDSDDALEDQEGQA